MRKLLVVTAFLLFAGIASGQSVQSGVILGLHEVTVTLDPDITMNQYVEYVNTKLKPEFDKLVPGLNVFILKGTRGENEHGIGLLYWVESQELRDKLWPTEGETNEEFTKAMEGISELMEKWGAMEVSFSSKYTDWVVL